LIIRKSRTHVNFKRFEVEKDGADLMAQAKNKLYEFGHPAISSSAF
jgi:hypothetical protein